MSLTLDLVESWHAALNSGEVDNMLSLASVPPRMIDKC